MSEKEIYEIADSAEMIVAGYAFKKNEKGFIDIINLEHPECTMVIRSDGEMIATNMSEIEQTVVLNISRKNLQFMEE